MKKAPKRKGYASGGETPKLTTKAEFDKYYSSHPNYAVDPLYKTGTRYYDKTKLTFDPATQKYSGVGMTGMIGEGNPESKYFAEFKAPNPIANAIPGKAVVADTGRKPVFTGSPYYDTFQVADELGQYGNATTEYVDKKTGQKIDVSKSFNEKGEYIPYGLANGGIVKKLKGYANGTGKAGVDSEVVDKYSNVQNESGFKGQAQTPNPSMGAGIGLATQLGDMAGNYLAQDAINYSGTVNENEATASGALKGASKGAQMGQSFGPWGLAIGAGLGALGGGYMARKGAQDVNEGIDYGNRMAGYETARNEQANKMSAGLEKELQKRQEGFAEGGEIKGKGGPKDDAIKAKVKGGSFIVPAENAEKAKAVKKMIAPKKKDNEEADLDQEDGEEVKLSNGEFMFTPEEKDEIIKELGEEFLEMLAPNAEDEDEGMREGGLTPHKAKKMLHEGTANGKPLTDKQRGYFGLIASGYKCGGMVKGYADGGEVPKTKGQKGTYRGMNVTFDGKNWVTDDGSIKYAANVLDDVLKKQAEKAAKDEAIYQGQKLDMLKRHYESIKNDPERKAEADRLYKQLYPEKTKSSKNIPSKSDAEIEKALGNGPNKTSPKVGFKNEFMPTGETSDTEVPVAKTTPTQTPQEKSLIDSALKAEAENADVALGKEKAIQNSAVKRNENISKGLGIGLDIAKGVGNYAFPYYQYKTGKEFLANAGPRPIDRIDPDFLRTVTTAQANAKFGMTPEEQSLLNQQNVNALRAGQEAAQNYSGGSGGVAFNLARQAGTDYYTRGLKAALADKELQMNKQAYADQLVNQKASMSRNLFNDSMNAWQQNQTAGGNLIGAALSNAIGAQRLNQEQQFQNQYNQNNNPWKNYNLGI